MNLPDCMILLKLYGTFVYKFEIHILLFCQFHTLLAFGFQKDVILPEEPVNSESANVKYSSHVQEEEQLNASTVVLILTFVLLLFF